MTHLEDLLEQAQVEANRLLEENKRFTKLAAYFEKRAKENTKRAKDKEEQSKSLRVGGVCPNWAHARPSSSLSTSQ